jgi:hypothetical protein
MPHSEEREHVNHRLLEIIRAEGVSGSYPEFTADPRSIEKKIRMLETDMLVCELSDGEMSALDRMNDTIQSVTRYGYRLETPDARSYRAIWSNASARWIGPSYDHYRSGEEVKLDSNEVLIPARNRHSATKVMECMDPHPLYALSTEYGRKLEARDPSGRLRLMQQISAMCRR